jgi:hypothetical protein
MQISGDQGNTKTNDTTNISGSFVAYFSMIPEITP